jgi:hypothetical protein
MISLSTPSTFAVIADSPWLMYYNPLCLTLVLILLPVYFFKNTQKCSSNIIMHLNFSIIKLTERRLIENKGTCKTDDRLMNDVHSTDLTPWIGWEVPSAIRIVSA